MPTVKSPDVEPLPGYRLIEPLGAGGFGEVWKCVAPGGLFKAIKFVHGKQDSLAPGDDGVQQELSSLNLVKAIRHPFLLSIERAEILDGDLVIVTELADRSLQELLDDYRAAGRPGIPRDELLGYLAEAAEALDVLNQEYGLQHRDVKPRNLFLIGRHVKVADFGLVNSLTEDGKSSGALTPLYGAPESFLGKLTLYSDQYSLAISYHELLTGTLPFQGKNVRQMAMLHLQAEPDLTLLPEGDRPVVARALAKDPRQRFPSCAAFIAALQGQSVPAAPARPAPRRTGLTLSERRPGDMGVTPSGAAQAAAQHLDSVTATPTPGTTAPGVNVLSGYRFLECVTRQPFLETWRAVTAQGERRLVKLLQGFDPDEQRPEGNPLVRLRAIQHEVLAPLEILRDGNRVALVVAPGEETLATQLRDRQRTGQPGIPRNELLDYLLTVAEGLDCLFQRHRYQHLVLNPRQLAVLDGQVRLLDFGMAELFWLPLGVQPSALNTRYSAPELFQGQITRSCDQYSLALIYQELLTGVHPFRNLNQRQMASARLRGQPDLGMLPATDRPAVLRALHANPDERFRSCTEFVEMLLNPGSPPVGPASPPVTRVAGSTLPELKKPGSAPRQPAARSPAVSPQLKRYIERQTEAAGVQLESFAVGAFRFQLHRAVKDATPHLEHHCFARVVAGTAGLKLDGFRQQYRAERVRTKDGAFVFRVPVGGGFLARCLGKTPGLEVRIELLEVEEAGAATSIRVRIQPIDCGEPRGTEILKEVGPVLLKGVRDYLQADPDPRASERIPFTETIQAAPALGIGQAGNPILAQARDLSLDGLSFYLPCKPPTPYLYVGLPQEGPDDLVAAGRVVHATLCKDGRYLVGLCFVSPEDVVG